MWIGKSDTMEDLLGSKVWSIPMAGNQGKYTTECLKNIFGTAIRNPGSKYRILCRGSQNAEKIWRELYGFVTPEGMLPPWELRYYSYYIDKGYFELNNNSIIEVIGG